MATKSQDECGRKPGKDQPNDDGCDVDVLVFASDFEFVGLKRAFHSPQDDCDVDEPPQHHLPVNILADHTWRRKERDHYTQSRTIAISGLETMYVTAKIKGCLKPASECFLSCSRTAAMHTLLQEVNSDEKWMLLPITAFDKSSWIKVEVQHSYCDWLPKWD